VWWGPAWGALVGTGAAGLKASAPGTVLEASHRKEEPEVARLLAQGGGP